MAQWEDAYDRAEGLAKVRFMADRVNGNDCPTPSLYLSLAPKWRYPCRPCPYLSVPSRSPPFSYSLDSPLTASNLHPALCTLLFFAQELKVEIRERTQAARRNGLSASVR